MPIINIVLVLMLIGIALWLINTYVPMAGSIKTLLNLVVVIATVVWVLQSFGILHDLRAFWPVGPREHVVVIR
jgi:hypothetical protein